MRIALALSLLVGVAGCKKTLHWKVLEDQLLAQITPRIPPGIHVAVSCPETPVEKGLTFRCRVDASDDSSAEIAVTLTDTAGSYTMEPVR